MVNNQQYHFITTLGSSKVYSVPKLPSGCTACIVHDLLEYAFICIVALYQSLPTPPSPSTDTPLFFSITSFHTRLESNCTLDNTSDPYGPPILDI